MQLSNEMILELHDIKMSYSNARKEVFNLLDGVNLGVEEGKVTALIGGNGAGKTTLFNIISGFLKGFKGKVMLEGHDITRLSAHRISRMGMGRLFQGRQLMDDLTLLENMKVASDDMTGESPFDSFFRPKKVKLCEINVMDYYVESKWKKFNRMFRFGSFAKETLYIIYLPGYQYNFAPGLPSDEQDEVLDRLEEAVTAAKEREGIKAEEEYWEAVEEFSCDNEGL